MTEKDFQVSLTRGLRAQGCFCAKWPDLARAVIKPFDLLMAYEGRFYPIECKLSRRGKVNGLLPNVTVISRKDFSPHQLPTLLEIHAKGQGKPYIAVCAITESLGRIIQRRAWLLPADIYHNAAMDKLTIKDLNTDYKEEELIWKPGLGWNAPWLPEPVTYADLREMLKEEKR